MSGTLSRRDKRSIENFAQSSFKKGLKAAGWVLLVLVILGVAGFLVTRYTKFSL